MPDAPLHDANLLSATGMRQAMIGHAKLGGRSGIIA
jgi:hypothetical protein